METRIVDRPAMRVIGIARRLDPMNTDWGDIWRHQFEPYLPALGPLMCGEACYGLYYETGEPPLMDFVGGVPVAPGTEPPGDELVARDVPAGRYLRVACAMHEIGATWDAIFSEWLPAAEFEHDPTRPCYEEFPPGCETGAAPVCIYTSIQPKG